MRKGKKVFKLKKSVRISLLVLAGIIVLLCCVFSLNRPHSVSVFYSPSDSGAILLDGGKMAGDVIPGRSVSAYRGSADDKAGAVLMSDGDSYTLYYAANGKYREVSRNSGGRFVISYKGNSVAYLDVSSNLFLFHAKNAKTEIISENTVRFTLSPDGSRVLYSKMEENREKLYLYENGVSTFICDNYLPLAVSDDASYLYALSSDASLCLLNRDGTVFAKICSSVDTGQFYFSADLSSVAFYDGSYTYLSHEGKSRVRLMEEQAFPAQEQSYILCDSQGTASICADDDLSGLFFVSSEENGSVSLYFVSDSDERTTVADSVKSFVLTEKKGIVWLSGSEIYSFYEGKITEIVNDAVDFTVTQNGKYIYYISGQSELFAYRKGRVQLLASGVSSLYRLQNGCLLFIMADGSLYSAKKMSYGEKIDENVYACAVTPSAVFYYKNYSAQTGTFSLYASDGSLDFSLVSESVSLVL